MSDERDEQPESVLSGLQPFEWSDEQSVSYEVALELVSQVVGGFEALINREQGKASPDDELIRDWNAAEDRFLARRKSLRLNDNDEIRRLTADCTDEIRRIRAAL